MATGGVWWWCRAALFAHTSQPTGTEAVGHTREYAEALQRINKLYKLSAGKFVQPDILMSRLLSLPRGFDHVVETIESINGMRAGSSQPPLDFHEVLGKVVPLLRQTVY